MFHHVRIIWFISIFALFTSITHQLSTSPPNQNSPTNSISLQSIPIHQKATKAQPFYLIAHRVLTGKAIEDALRNGANAVEIDMTAYEEGWWADHDHAANSWGDSASDIFTHIANSRRAGKKLTFVWLDIKNPDWCDPKDAKWRHCSVRGLRDLARRILQPAGIRVLYGFILGANSRTYGFIRDGLNGNEAINLDGNPKTALQRFESGGPVDKSRRVSSYGDADFSYEFGDCMEEKYYTCTELRQAVATGKFGRVFGWTSSVGQGEYVRRELAVAGVDGVIYGFGNADYRDAVETRAAAKDLVDWVVGHPDRRFIAGNDHPPW